MLIRNFTNDDIMQYSLLHDINWNKIDKSLSLIIFDDKGNIEAYIIIEQNGVCPEIIYEEDSKSYKIIDIIIERRVVIIKEIIVSFMVIHI